MTTVNFKFDFAKEKFDEVEFHAVRVGDVMALCRLQTTPQALQVIMEDFANTFMVIYRELGPFEATRFLIIVATIQASAAAESNHPAHAALKDNGVLVSAIAAIAALVPETSANVREAIVRVATAANAESNGPNN